MVKLNNKIGYIYFIKPIAIALSLTMFILVTIMLLQVPGDNSASVGFWKVQNLSWSISVGSIFLTIFSALAIASLFVALKYDKKANGCYTVFFTWLVILITATLIAEIVIGFVNKPKISAIQENYSANISFFIKLNTTPYGFSYNTTGLIIVAFFSAIALSIGALSTLSLLQQFGVYKPLKNKNSSK